MQRKMYIRLFIGVLVASLSFALFSYSRIQSSKNEDNDCNESGKCPQKKAQTEYILWETLTHNFLSARG